MINFNYEIENEKSDIENKEEPGILKPFIHFNEELDQLKNEMGDVDELYNEIKDHYDLVKKTRDKGSLTFTHMQLGNLVSLKNSKFSLLRDKIYIKRSIAELVLKMKNNEEAGAEDNAIIKQLYEKLINEESRKEDSGIIRKKIDEPLKDEENEEIERILDQKVISIKSRKKKNREEIKEEVLEIIENEKFEESVPEIENSIKDYILAVELYKNKKDEKKRRFVGLADDGSININFAKTEEIQSYINNIKLKIKTEESGERIAYDKITERIFPIVDHIKESE